MVKEDNAKDIQNVYNNRNKIVFTQKFIVKKRRNVNKIMK